MKHCRFAGKSLSPLMAVCLVLGMLPLMTAPAYAAAGTSLVRTVSDTDPAQDAAAEPWTNPFTDVREDAWYYGDVAFAAANGLFSGTGAATFSPDTPMTRGMFVTALYRLAGTPAVRMNDAFDDVTEDKWYYEPVNWAAQSGVVSGVGGGRFAPDAHVTREQMAHILLSYAKHAGVAPQGAWEVRLNFADADKISDWAVEAAMYCSMNGIITGKPGSLFDPQGAAARAEAAAVLHRFAESY